MHAAKPEHYTQMQLYMRWSGMDRAFYTGVCKDDDRIYSERIHFDAKHAELAEAKGQRIVEAPTPPAGISEDPAFYQCKWCPASSVCHRGEGTQVNCRTCLHATPEMDGNARWSCARHGKDIDVATQRKGCAEHRLIPDLITWAKPVDANESEN